MSSAPTTKRFVPFAYGFRPFFLAALVYGLAAIAIWVYVRAVSAMPLPNLPPQLWHGHEMLYGFVGAAIAGFLLTAVPSWTGARGFAGWPLIALCALWAAGRIAFASATYLPPRVVALAELAFLPALAFMVAVPLLRARNRNTPLLAILVALWVTDATFLCAMARGELTLASMMLRVGINTVLLLITVIGGRIVPAFTANALRRRGIDAPVRSNAWIDGLAIGAMIAVLIVDALAPASMIAALVTAFVAGIQAIRLLGWQVTRTFKEPLVWVLHLAYAGLPIGFALKAIHLITGAPWAADWLHVLTVGVVALMIVAVITRASLGHTGRELVVTKWVALAYGILAGAALLRGGATLFMEHREWLVSASAALWISAFSILIWVYAPILLRPRVDGREG